MRSDMETKEEEEKHQMTEKECGNLYKLGKTKGVLDSVKTRLPPAVQNAVQMVWAFLYRITGIGSVRIYGPVVV